MPSDNDTLSLLWLGFGSEEIVDHLNEATAEMLGTPPGPEPPGPFWIQGDLTDTTRGANIAAGGLVGELLGDTAGGLGELVGYTPGGVVVGAAGAAAYAAYQSVYPVGTIRVEDVQLPDNAGKVQWGMVSGQTTSGITLQLANGIGTYRNNIETASKGVAGAFATAWGNLRTVFGTMSLEDLEAAFAAALGQGTFNKDGVILQLENIVMTASRSAPATYALVGATELWKPINLTGGQQEADYESLTWEEKEAWAKTLLDKIARAAGATSYPTALKKAFAEIGTELDTFRQAAFAFKWLPHTLLTTGYSQAGKPNDWFGASLVYAIIYDANIGGQMAHLDDAAAKVAEALYSGDKQRFINEHNKQRDIAAALEKNLYDRLLYGDQDKLTFKEQCFLLSKIFDLVAYKEKQESHYKKPLPYNGQAPKENQGWNSSLMIHGDPYALMNRLTQHPNASVFFDMENKDISSLQPMIRLYKVKEDSDGNEVQQELIFDSYATQENVESVFADKTKRGFGVGIKDFTFSYEGDSPFAAKKAIKARLNIFANSFDELLKDRGPTDDQYKYIDLALKTGKIKKIEEKKETDDPVDGEENKEQEEDAVVAEIDDRLNFRLKALVGWAVPDGATTVNTDVLDAVYDSFVTLQLTPTVHDFKFDDQGRINFIIDYLAYIEEGFDQSAFNIFFDTGASLRAITRKFKSDYIASTCKPTVMEQWRKDKKDNIANDKKLALQSIFKALWKDNKIKFINMTRAELNKFASQGPFYEAPAPDLGITDWEAQDAGVLLGQAQAIDTAVAAAEGDISAGEEALNEQNIKNEQISFFYVSDLVDVLLKGIDENINTLATAFGAIAGDDDMSSNAAVTTAAGAGAVVQSIKKEIGQYYTKTDIALEHQKMRGYARQFKKLRILLGPLELVNPRNAVESTFVNFGDIPISTRYFIEWLTTKTLSRDTLQFPLPAFLNQFFNNLVSNFLNDDSCFSVSVKQKTVVNQAVITSYKNKEIDEITEYINEIRKKTGADYLSRAILSAMPQPVLNISGDRGSPVVDKGVESETNYYVFFAARTQPTELMRGIRKTYTDTTTGETIIGDEDRGIFHYMIGKDRGIVKTIQLSKTTLGSYKPMRFELEGYDGLEQLREVYNVDIACYANVNTFPGTYIYVDPHGFAPNTVTADDTDFNLTKYGIGGYCMIYRSEHSFGAGVAESRLQARWVAQAEDGEVTETSTNSKAKHRTGRGDDSKSLCKTFESRAPATKSWLDKSLDFFSDFVYHGAEDDVSTP